LLHKGAWPSWSWTGKSCEWCETFTLALKDMRDQAHAQDLPICSQMLYPLRYHSSIVLRISQKTSPTDRLSNASIFWTVSFSSGSLIPMSWIGSRSGNPSGNRLSTSWIDFNTPWRLSLDRRSLGMYSRTAEIFRITDNRIGTTWNGQMLSPWDKLKG